MIKSRWERAKPHNISNKIEWASQKLVGCDLPVASL